MPLLLLCVDTPFWSWNWEGINGLKLGHHNIFGWVVYPQR